MEKTFLCYIMRVGFFCCFITIENKIYLNKINDSFYVKIRQQPLYWQSRGAGTAYRFRKPGFTRVLVRFVLLNMLSFV